MFTLLGCVNKIFLDPFYPPKTRVLIKFGHTARSNTFIVFSELRSSSWGHSYAYVLFLETEIEVSDFSQLVLRFFP
jgi:hypothetical protein